MIAKLHWDAQKVADNDAMNTSFLNLLWCENLTTCEDNHLTPFLMMLIIILFFSAEADQHDNVRQSVVCKRRGFNSVVRYASTVYDWLTFWTLCPHKSQGLITVSLHAYLVEIAMLRLAVRLERCNSIDFMFLNAKLL